MSADTTDIRRHVVDVLAPLLPRTWKWFDHSTSLDALSTTTLVLTLEDITRMPESPKTWRNVTYTLTILDPSTNPAQRENSLDDSIVELLNAIDDIPDLAWSKAQRGTVGVNLGFDVSLQFPFERVFDTEGA